MTASEIAGMRHIAHCNDLLAFIFTLRYRARNYKGELLMGNLADRKAKPDRERGFKRGYIHGAQALANAVERHLSSSENFKLRAWLAELRQWQARGPEFSAPPPLPEL